MSTPSPPGQPGDTQHPRVADADQAVPPAGAAPTVLFVGGLGRSGSTLLELLLAQSPEVCALGEVVHLWHRALGRGERCGCGMSFVGCPFWQEVGTRAFGGWDHVDPTEVHDLQARVDRTRHIPRLAGSRPPAALAGPLRRYTAYYQRIYQAAAELSGARVVIDSSKHASLAFALRHADDLDLRILHLVRDSRGVAHSWAKQVRRPEVTDEEAYMPRFSPARASALWNAQNAAFDLLARWAPVTRLRYEDFTADPVGWLTHLRTLVGLPASGQVRRLFDDPPPTVVPAHTVAGNPLRFEAGPVRVRRDDAWRIALPRRRRALVGTLTLPLRLRYGYCGALVPRAAP